MAILQMIHRFLMFNPGMRACVVRPTYKTVKEHVVGQLRDKLLRYGFDPHPNNPIERPIGGNERTEALLYKNGARMIFGGMDDPGKILGGEYDLVFYNQVEQGKEEHWEEFWGRLRFGRWTYPYGPGTKLLIGDCNPSRRKHWILNRADKGITELRYAQLTANPYLYYNGEWTQEGQEYVESCKKRFTGMRLLRGLYGIWCSPDGVVYPEFDEDNEVEEWEIPIKDNWIWSASVDHGYNHPFVFQLWCAPPNRSKNYLYKEVYQSQLDVDDLKDEVAKLLQTHLPSHQTLKWCVADHRPEINKTVQKIGIRIDNAEKEVLPGIDLCKTKLRDNTILFNKNSLSHAPDRVLHEKSYPTRTVEEFDRYSYKEEDKMDGSEKDEYPAKGFDDGMDPMRYEAVKFFAPHGNYQFVSAAVPPTSLVPSYV